MGTVRNKRLLRFGVLNGHRFNQKLKPKNIPTGHSVLAIIRPAKRHLQDSDWNTIMDEVWVKPEEGYFFKKAHAVSYAVAVVVHMNLIVRMLMQYESQDFRNKKPNDPGPWLIWVWS